MEIETPQAGPTPSNGEATLRVNEIFLSVQGESSFAGLPCIFVRLAGCHLRCSYCDTVYAFTEGDHRSLDAVQTEVLRLAKPYPEPTRALRLPIVELTGGEPLLQANSLPLMVWLCDQGFTILLETSGALDISGVDPRVCRIMDIKCPSSGEMERNRWDNLRFLKETDEVKFVIGSRQDYAWARETLFEHELHRQCTVLFSGVYPPTQQAGRDCLKPVPSGHDPIGRRELAEQILKDGLPVRFQLQLHKEIWPPDMRGV